MRSDNRDYDALIRPIEDQMMRSIWRVTQNADDAEEALQEALGVVWRKLERIKRHANPHALILRICLNASHDVLRKRHRQRRREERYQAEKTRRPVTPDEVAQSKERERAILRAIGTLSQNQAAAVTMRLVQGESYETIASTLGCKANTARKHVARGRERLRQLLAPLAPKLGKGAGS